MHYPLHWGHYYKIKEKGEIQFRCCICRIGATCAVEEWNKRFHISYIPVKVIGRGYLFTWNECGHSLGMDDPEVVRAYETRVVVSDRPAQPYCSELKPIEIERPWKVTWKGILLISPLILFSGGLVLLLVGSILILPLLLLVFTILEELGLM